MQEPWRCVIQNPCQERVCRRLEEGSSLTASLCRHLSHRHALLGRSKPTTEPRGSPLMGQLCWQFEHWGPSSGCPRLSIAVWSKAVLAPFHVADLPPILNVFLDYLPPSSALSFRQVALPPPSSNSTSAPASKRPQLMPHGTSPQFHQLLQSWFTCEVSRRLDFYRWAWRSNRGAKK